MLLDVFRKYPEAARPLLELHEALLRGESPFTVAQRELIAALVSAVNACDYCHGVHQATAEALGVEPGLLVQLMSDVDAAPIHETMRPVLRLVRQLTERPSRVEAKDVEALDAAG